LGVREDLAGALREERSFSDVDWLMVSGTVFSA
jgi:hypothetical protein